jgi:hypothetical protein
MASICVISVLTTADWMKIVRSSTEVASYAFLRAVSAAWDALPISNKRLNLKQTSDRNAEYLGHPFKIVEAGSLEATFHITEEVHTGSKSFGHLFLSPVF